MRTRLVLSACIGTLLSLSGVTLAADEADASWSELQTLMRGPATRPKTADEAREELKKRIPEFDAKAAAFRKAHPNDPRRWKIGLHELQINNARGVLGLPKRSNEELQKLAGEIAAATDADGETKAMASFYGIVSADLDEKTFKERAEAHLKAYPDFPRNRQLTAMLKTKEAELEVKSKPLDLKFTAVDGSTVDVSQMRGKVVLIDFWATWCGPCIVELPNVIAAYDKFHDKGFEIVGISFDQDKEKLEKMTKEKGIKWPQFFDGKGWKNDFGQRFGINSIPRMWLVNKAGMVVDTNGRENLASKVEKLLGE